MPTQIHELESAAIDDSRLLVRLRFEVDRFVTELFLATEDSISMVLGSDEGTSANIWPPSGPLQEVLPQDMASGRCLTAVGRAGKSHWSAVIAPVADGGAVEFDFACRIKEPAAFIGSSYCLAQDIAFDSADEMPRIVLGKRSIRCRVGRGAFKLDPKRGRLVVGPSHPAETYPETMRWQYRFELS